MPQDTIFPTDPRCTGLSISVSEVPTEGGQAYNITVQEVWSPGGPRSVFAQRWSGYQLDLLSTLVEDVTAAWMYGEARDVGRAAVSVAKVASAHARRHDRATV